MTRGGVRAETMKSDGYNPIPVPIAHDGFERSRTGAEFFHWRHGRFVKWITSD